MKQTAEIRDWLDTHPEGLTPLDALELFGTFRLGARVFDIRNGVGCEPLAIETVNETRGGKTYARYKKAERQPSLL